ncbi:MAG: hypothetical protein JWM80_4399 [Cyanobacteria bacterium RYN_339]|nr:hypothetical protein [Cyanobacteria bacterium RYN_339]
MPASFAPTWHLATERAFRAAAVASCRGRVETWVVAPFSLAASYASLVAAEGTGVCMAQDWAQLAGTLEQRLLLPHRPTASPLEWTAAMVRALRAMAAEDELPQAFREPVAKDVMGVAAALSQSLLAVFEHAPTLHEAPESGRFVSANLQLLLGLKARVTEDLAARHLTTGPMRWGAIAAALRAGPCPGLPARLILDGIDTLDIARAEAVLALAARGVELLAPPWLPLPGLTSVALTPPAPPTEAPQAVVLDVRDVHEEVAGAVAWVRDRLEGGAELSSLAVMVPQGAGYEPLLHDAFCAVGLPVSAPHQPVVTALRELQALRAFASVRTARLDVVDLVTLLAAAEVVNGPALAKLADQLYEKLPAKLVAVADVAAKAGLTPDELGQVEDALKRLAMPPRLLEDELAAFWEYWIATPDPALSQAAADVLRVHTELHDGGSLASWPALLESLLDVPARPGRPNPQAVSVLHAGPYAPMPLAHLLVLGFCDGTFPGSMKALPLLGASEIGALAQVQAVVPAPVERASWEMRNVWRMLAIAPHVTLSVPERTLAGEGLRPSPVLEQVVRLPTPAPGHRQTLPEWRLATARGLASGNAPDAGMGAWVDAAVRPAPAFQIDPQVVAALTGTLSPSSIDVLLACPFAFYAKSLVKLKDRPVARALGWDPALSGTIGHRVLEVMLDTKSDAELLAADVAPTLTAVLAEDFPGLHPPAYRLQLDFLRQDLEAFVARYADLAATLGARGGHSEWPFKLEMSLPGRPHGVTVRGFIDRVLLRDGPPIAIDFKSGDVAKYQAQRAAGLGAQVAVYAWALEKAGIGLPAAFTYLTLGGRKVETDVIAARGVTLPAALPVNDTEPLEAFQERLLAALAAQLDALDTGAIAPLTAERGQTLEAAKAHPCRYCEFDLLCRSRQGTPA